VITVVNHAMASHAKIAEAIDEAMSELSDVQERLTPLLEQARRLEHRAQQLEAFISAGRIVVGEGSESETPTPQTPPTSNSLPRTTLSNRGAANRGNRTVGDCLKILLEERQRPMTLLEMTQELLTRKWIEGKWAREVIRNAVNRGKEFERIIPGVFALKHWPDTLKRWPQSEAHVFQGFMGEEAHQNGSAEDDESDWHGQSENSLEEDVRFPE
jgi:hypothetical protein